MTKRLFVWMTCLGASAVADTVTLFNGTTLESRHVSIEGDRVILEQLDGRIILPKSAVQDITYASSFPAPASANDPAAVDLTTYLPVPSGATNSPTGQAGSALGPAESLLAEGQLGAAKAAAEEALRTNPQDLGALRVRAAIALREGRNSAARDDLAVLLVARPDDPAALALAGELAYRQQRYDEAIQQWEHALELQPNAALQKLLQQARREHQDAGQFESPFSSLFQVREEGQVNSDLAHQVVEALEADYQQLAPLLDLKSSTPIPAVLYPEADFLASTGLTRHVVLGLFDGKVRIPLGGVFELDGDVRSTLRHELTHALVYIKSAGRAPRWLQEGLAQRLEGRSAANYEAEFAEILRSGAPVPLASYPYWLALVEYVENRHGQAALNRILADLGQDAEVDQALSRELGLDFNGLQQAWRQDLLQRVP
jgi:tetratricopeptide (TPR) repeat protein